MERAQSLDQRIKISDFLINTLLYVIAAIAFYWKFPAASIIEKRLLWPVFWLSRDILGFTLMVLKIALVVGPILTFFRRSQVAGQILTALAALLWISIFYSQGKSYHSGRLVLIFLLFHVPLRFFLADLRAVHLSYFIACTSYLSSGLWKLRFAVNHIIDTGDLSFIHFSLQEHVAATAVEKLTHPPFLGQLILQSSCLSGFLWLGAILLELSLPLVLLRPQYTFLLSAVYAIFHLGVLFTMNINFMTSIFFQILCCIYFYLNRNQLKSLWV